LEPLLIRERVGTSHNPHVWLDPLLVLHGVTNVLRAMQAADPPQADVYAANATAYIQTLTRLHAEVSALLVPFSGKPIVTFHNAFPYLARRYGLKVVGVVQPVSDVAPSGRYLSELRQSILHHGVKVIFTESGHSDRLPRQLASDLKIAIAPLDTLETGSMDPGRYVQRMRRNAEVIATHLKAHASAR
jgi:zinc/manganese transport system substrate-binding protein